MAAFGSLAGRLAVVTGGGGGLGRAICEKFARLGASVLIVDLKKEHAQETCSLLHSGPDQEHFPVHCDVSGIEFVDQLRQVALEHYKKAPEILVNNAGVTMDAQLSKMSEAQFDWVMDINLKGTFLMTKAFSREMVQRGTGGSIINISSIVGKTGNFGQVNYAASKAGVIGLTKSCAIELGPKRVRVNAVLPGFIETAMTAKVPEKVLEEIIKSIPMHRMGRPEEIADCCAFLASDASSYINGAAIEVTGGLGM